MTKESKKQTANVTIETEKRSHFEGKSVVQHLRQARMKGVEATGEEHGLEPKGHIIAGADSAKETAVITLLLWIVLSQLIVPFTTKAALLAFFVFGFFLWKMGRAALISWARLERVDRLIADEKHEIETNREEEKEELTEIYRAKGFTSPLLDKVIDVLMADDNKLLGVMLEEELGVTLNTYEHPLKQAIGSGIGVLLSGCMLLIGMLLPYEGGVFLMNYLTVAITAYIIAKLERIAPLSAIVWYLALAFVATFAFYFLSVFFLERGLFTS